MTSNKQSAWEEVLKLYPKTSSKSTAKMWFEDGYDAALKVSGLDKEKLIEWLKAVQTDWIVAGDFQKSHAMDYVIKEIDSNVFDLNKGSDV